SKRSWSLPPSTQPKSTVTSWYNAMPFLQAITVGSVLAGALFLAISLYLSLQAIRSIPPPLRLKWLFLGGLMSFFLAGYFIFLFIQLRNIPFPLEILTSTVFFFGALFVLLITRITLRTLEKLNEHEQQLEEVNETLSSKNAALEEEISRRLIAEQSATARLQHLASLHAIDTVVSASLDLRVTLKVFLDQLIPRFDIDAAAVLLLDPFTQTLEYAAGKGFRGTAIEQSKERLGQGSAGRAAMERKGCMTANLAEAGEKFLRHDLLKDEGFLAYCALPLVAKGEVQGVLEIYYRRPFQPDAEWQEFLESLAVRAAIAIENASLFNDLQRSNAELILAYDTTIEGWGRALELRDRETQGHTERVAAMSKRMAQEFGMREEKLVHVVRGALLHDIGKMAISDSILLKKGPLTEEERQIMQKHPVYAFELLSPIAYLQPALDIPYCHHERWDGSGYPRQLKGEQIPLAARIFSVVDTWDALTTARRYHEAWSKEKVQEPEPILTRPLWKNL
ncbi:MAG: HD domain-containing phosphohydrolase, partial [Deltaproteobacteria bacterium]